MKKIFALGIMWFFINCSFWGIFKKGTEPPLLYDFSILYIEGVMQPLDSLGERLYTMPFYFLYKNENYIFDIRGPGGGGYFYLQKRADTAWMVNYLAGIMAVVPVSKDIVPFVGMPFTPRELPFLFCLKPQNFEEMVKEINIEGNNKWVITTRSGLIIEGDRNGVKEFRKKDHHIIIIKRGKKVPQEVIYNKGFLVEGTFSTKIIIKKIKYEVPKDVWRINTKKIVRKVDLRE